MFSFLHNPLPRKTPVAEMRLGNHVFYLSYSTIVGYIGAFGACRRINVWGPTTGRHIRELDLNDYPQVDEETMKQRLNAVLVEVGSALAIAKIAPGESA